MKRWFCGFSSTVDFSLSNFPQPLQGEALWQGINSCWVCGNWGKQQIITLFEGSVRVAIIGTCLEPYETLVQVFQNAVRKHDYSRMMKLPGSFNLIVQDDMETYVFVDVAGLRPVFYTEYNSGIAYASLGVALQQLVKADVDASWIANSFMGLATLNIGTNRSSFCNVKSVSPGHYLYISGTQAICKRYWYPPQEYISLPAAAEQLREQLLTAVEGRVRLYGNLTSDLSGGFDSTSLALLAAKSLAKQGKNLHTLTVKTVSAMKSEDFKWAEHAASLYPNIEPVMIEAQEIPGEYSHLDAIPLIDAPELVLLCIGQFSYSMAAIRAKGSQVHLSGDGGDAVLSRTTSYLTDLLKRGKIKSFFQHTYGWSRINRSTPLKLMNSAVKLSLTPYRQWLLQQAKILKQTQASNIPFQQILMKKLPLGWDSSPDIASWYTENCVDLSLAELEEWAKIGTPLVNFPGEHESISFLQWGALTSRGDQQLAEIYGINLELPFFDGLVIDACLSAEPQECTTPFAYKPLLPQALQYDLPKSVFTRNSKGDYTDDEFIGFRENLNFIQDLFRNSLLVDMGLIDITKIISMIEKFNMGLIEISTNFHQTLATELWLRSLVNTKNSFWKSTN